MGPLALTSAPPVAPPDFVSFVAIVLHGHKRESPLRRMWTDSRRGCANQFLIQMARAPSCAIWNEKAPRRMRTYNVVTSESRRQIVSRADDVVKQSVHACQSSLHLDKKRRSKTVSSCDFSLLMSNRGALTWDVARRLTGCPQQSVSRLCPKSAVVSASCGTRSFEQVHVVELVG